MRDTPLWPPFLFVARSLRFPPPTPTARFCNTLTFLAAGRPPAVLRAVEQFDFFHHAVQAPDGGDC